MAFLLAKFHVELMEWRARREFFRAYHLAYDIEGSFFPHHKISPYSVKGFRARAPARM
jgi:hypothetical protein